MTCLVIWKDMLTEITCASTAMQSADISLDTAVLLIDNLKKFFPVQREWVWKGCDRCTSFSECMWCLYRVCTEAQNISRRSERWTTRAPGRPASFQTNSVLCNRWHHTQWTQHKICKSGADFREVSFHFANALSGLANKAFKVIVSCLTVWWMG